MAVLRNASFGSLSQTIRGNTVENSLKLQSKTSCISNVKNVKSVLINFHNRIDIRAYQDLLFELKNSDINDDVLHQLLSDVREVISVMDHHSCHFVEALLDLKWFSRGNEAAQEYQHFLIDLLSAHNYYVNYAIEKLVSSFKAVFHNSKWPDGLPSVEEKCCFEKVHDVLKILLQIIPMSSAILCHALSTIYPYFKLPTNVHEVYLYNLLKITEYRPDLRLDILLIIVNNMVHLDVHAPREAIEDVDYHDMDISNGEPEIFTMDESAERREKQSMAHPIANTLDVVLAQLFKYFHAVCYQEKQTLDWEAAKRLYHDLMVVFERLILPTHNAHHVQFIMFYVCSFKVTIAEAFLNSLWRFVSSPNEAPTIRKTAVMYITSFLARATFIPISILKDMLAKIATWVHNYISHQDRLDGASSDIRIHGVFFSICQALFYVIAFRHADLVNTRKNLTFLQSLNLGKVVTCRLNPLKVCTPPIVQNFAAVTRTYQLAYCYTVIEHNARNVIPIIYKDETGVSIISSNDCLETLFPFDPYMLRRSGHAISPIYREYQAAQTPMKEAAPIQQFTCTEEEDDFLIDQSPSTSSLNPDLFSYSSSPGFKNM